MSEHDLESFIVGRSDVITQLRANVAVIARDDLAVLIEGPTGAGKELVARALHMVSGRAGRFVAFNVCAIPDSMFEATLFGHVRGAFTGATTDTLGYFGEADGGTAFLDEVGALAFHAQAKLLRVIETQEFRPIGAKADRRSDFRVIAATNEGLRPLVEEGRFRGDLASRLSGYVLRVPPLRDRIEDVPVLARHFLHRRQENGSAGLELGDSALRALERHEWPWNVRELKQVVDRATRFATPPLITARDVAAALDHSGLSQVSGPASSESLWARRVLDALHASDWDVERSADALGVSRATMYRWMKRAGLKPAPRGTRLRLRDGETELRGIGASANAKCPAS